MRKQNIADTGATLNDRTLQAAFGENIQIDATNRGVRVIIPKYGLKGEC